MPLIDQWDHATLIAQNDDQLLAIMRQAEWRHAVLPYDTTAENICLFVADYLIQSSREILEERQIHTVRVRVSETETCYAEAVKTLS